MTHSSAVLLLVENAATRRAGLAAVLVENGLSVETVTSAEDALDSLDHSLPALLLTDQILPGMNGCQMTRYLRLNRATRPLPVILLTNGNDPDLVREALLAGVDSCVPREADVAYLLARISVCLRGYRVPHALLRERFRRPTVAIVTGQDGLLKHLPHKKGDKGRSGTFPVVELLKTDGLEALLPPSTTLATPDLWLGGVDCVIVDLTTSSFDALALCQMLDRARRTQLSGAETPACLLGFGSEETGDLAYAIKAFKAGVDDLVPSNVTPENLILHVRVLLRRKAILDENLRSAAERAARDEAMEGARAKTVLADALEQANDELASANRKLIDAQTKLVQSAKMASLGELVAGIAHEFNNPLAFVIAHEDTVARALERAVAELEAGNVEIARAVLAKGRDRLAATSLGLGRMRDLVSSLRRFSRLDQGTFEDIDMPDAINTVLALLGPKLTDRIRVELDFQGPAVLNCQAALVHQVVMNVISNAADALHALPPDDPRVPCIRIGTQCVEGRGGQPDMWVATICDNGPGIPPLMRERVFEPFFTTKPVGEGTGLGLATAYGIVKAHHGSIEVSDSSAGGTCFTIAIPITQPGTSVGMIPFVPEGEIR
ncbi:two component sensor histidine kinase [Acetobacter estunensis NRIC 0472]|uniref:histidine kinase n=1 Tax=Acetobacter estunensis TaxID=104097 RepID=A0A967BAJ3_9PROT|nr:ATP-binding protein [Acetobacter estunensis]NHO53478.1 response regulator [Acetobacter estunensis]GBQ28950.1 two component sensor histidine kinase [Acetobacter estunensis NRIC 0472]